MTYSNKDVTLAVILTCCAGLSTVIGAMFSFCMKPHYIHLLPVALAFSAGVMIYVSFVELMSEGLNAFHEALESKHPDSFVYLSHIYLSLAFFGGILIGYALDFVVHLLGYNHDLPTEDEIDHVQREEQNAAHEPCHQHNHQRIASNTDTNTESSAVCHAAVTDIRPAAKEIDVDVDMDMELDNVRQPLTPQNCSNSHDIELTDPRVRELDDKNDAAQHMHTTESRRLMRTSLITALAIGLHNFPEGLATFVSTLADPTLGVSIAVAIGMHNIPEGIAVALPVYFATHSKWKAFAWAFVSGIAEPIGGLVGYAIINNLFSDTVFGVLFGFTGGIMIYISFKELLPTARERDPDDKWVTKLVFLGFLVMDISLVLFEIV